MLPLGPQASTDSLLTEDLPSVSVNASVPVPSHNKSSSSSSSLLFEGAHAQSAPAQEHEQWAGERLTQVQSGRDAIIESGDTAQLQN